MSHTTTPGAERLKEFIGDEAHPERSQHWLAKELGVSQPSVSAWLRGTSRPEPHMREAIELLTGIPQPAWETEEERAFVDKVRERIEQSTPPQRAA